MLPPHPYRSCRWSTGELLEPNDTNLVREGKKIVIEQNGRKCHPIVLAQPKFQPIPGRDRFHNPSFTLIEVLITVWVSERGEEKAKATYTSCPTWTISLSEDMGVQS